VAEELDVALDRVDMILGDTDACPYDMGTFGSLNIWQFGPVLRRAAAEARAVLVQMAAERLGVPAERPAHERRRGDGSLGARQTRDLRATGGR